jgi:hypothetical protein
MASVSDLVFTHAAPAAAPAALVFRLQGLGFRV